MYQSAASGGAQALGVTGGIRLGAPANIVTLRGENPDLALAQWVFSAPTAAVDTVWVRGIKRVASGKHELAASSKARFNAVVKKYLST